VCNGTETDIILCHRNDWGVNDCGHHEDVSITCNTGTNRCNECADQTLDVSYTDDFVSTKQPSFCGIFQL